MRYYGEMRHEENPTNCVVEVAWQRPKGYPTGGWARKQCGNKRGHGPGGLYCHLHGGKPYFYGDDEMDQPGFGVPKDESD